ncbi:MAG: hypothetical protein V4696_09480 [Pseudomonadota bacterium]
MMIVTALAAFAATTTAQAAPPAVTPPPIVRVETPAPNASAKDSGQTAAKKAADQAASMSMFAEMAVKALDRILPPQADPEPARLALARTAMDGFMPAGSYGRMFDVLTDNMMNDVYGRIMGMTGTELSNAVGLPIASGKDSGLTLMQQASKGDPMFDARLKAYVAAFKVEMRQSMNIMEPKLREGMARAMARRFDAAQLTDLNRFFATDTGRAFGRDMVLLWIDGDVFRGMFASMPEMMRAMPASAQRFEAIERQYPWPKKPEPKKAPAPRKKK